jgi:hypothetical protein
MYSPRIRPASSSAQQGFLIRVVHVQSRRRGGVRPRQLGGVREPGSRARWRYVSPSGCSTQSNADRSYSGVDGMEGVPRPLGVTGERFALI